MAKTYGQRPSSLLPSGTFAHEEQALAFDLNVMLLGMASEALTQVNDPRRGFTSTRREAVALGRRAQIAADAEFKEAS